MNTKGTIFGVLFLGLVTQAGALARAQAVHDSLEPIASQLDALKDGKSACGEKADCASSCSACFNVYGYAEILFLERTNCSSDQPVIVQTEDAIPVGTVFSTSDLDFDFDPAVRVVLGRRLHNGWAIEGSYLGLCDADASEFIVAPSEDPTIASALTFPGALASGANVFADMNRIWVDYSSALHSAELNFVHCCGCCTTSGHNKNDCSSKGDCGAGNMRCRTVEWLVGFRYLNLAERLNIYAERDQQTGGGTVEVEFPGVYDIRTSNNLFGPQIGARARRWGTKWGWEAAGKAGIFGNAAHQEQSVIDYPDFPESFPLRPETSAADGQVAFVGELNLTAIYRLSDVWNLRAGYNLIWIAGVALAPDQLDFSGTLPAGEQLSSNGSVFLHGVSCGMEARW